MPVFENDISRILFETKLIDGAFERLPSLGADPVLWPIVEQRLGRGVGCRVVNMYLRSLQATRAKPVIFMPPDWWQIEGDPVRIVQTWQDDGEMGELHRTPVKPRVDGGLSLENEAALMVRVRIEGQPLDIATTEAYALAYAEAVQASGGRLSLKYDAALRPLNRARLSR
jgi:hypothetical protein